MEEALAALAAAARAVGVPTDLRLAFFSFRRLFSCTYTRTLCEYTKLSHNNALYMLHLGKLLVSQDTLIVVTLALSLLRMRSAPSASSPHF